MSNYSEDETMCRVDFFFTISGKWLESHAVMFWDMYYKSFPEWALAEALEIHFKTRGGLEKIKGMTAVCLEPYIENSRPILVEF